MPTINKILSLNSEEQFLEKFRNEENFVIYKHSSTCSLSAMAKEEVMKYLESAPYKTIADKITFYEVLVIEQRPLSQKIAEKTTIVHQSPQILWIKNGRVFWNISHTKIKLKLLTQTLKAS